MLTATKAILKDIPCAHRTNKTLCCVRFAWPVLGDNTCNIRYLFSSEQQKLDETFIPWLLDDFICWLYFGLFHMDAQYHWPLWKRTFCFISSSKEAIRSCFPLSCGEIMKRSMLVICIYILFHLNRQFKYYSGIMSVLTCWQRQKYALEYNRKQSTWLGFLVEMLSTEDITLKNTIHIYVDVSPLLKVLYCSFHIVGFFKGN